MEAYLADTNGVNRPNCAETLIYEVIYAFIRRIYCLNCYKINSKIYEKFRSYPTLRIFQQQQQLVLPKRRWLKTEALVKAGGIVV